MARPTPEEAFRTRMAGNEKRATLRPLEPGETIDMGLRVYQRIAPMALRLTVLPMTLCQAALTFVFAVVLPALFTTNAPGNVGTELGELGFALGAGFLVAVPLFCFGLGRSMSLVACLASDVVLRLPPDPANAERRSASSTGVAVWTVALVLFWSSLLLLVSGVFAFMGMLFDRAGDGGIAAVGISAIMAVISLPIAIGAVPFVVKANALAPIVAALEDVKPRAALKRSQKLMKHYYGHGNALSVLLLTGISLLLVGSGLYGSLSLLIEKSGVGFWVESWNLLPGLGQMMRIAVESLPSFAMIWLLAPVWTTAMTVLYYDRIVRLEAYDVKVMIDDLAHADRRSVLLR